MTKHKNNTIRSQIDPEEKAVRLAAVYGLILEWEIAEAAPEKNSPVGENRDDDGSRNDDAKRAGSAADLADSSATPHTKKERLP